ncbi:hypothetical protein DY000_02025710 [Brassica cretica]|uniref:Uncharacterized protein n=1 Tax=Brassica cretica TaxID=69181 RepID=A0ABQ7E1A5_BRACR|nr:hypothetical protein DY000_02025710 [Brassica cretica]
MEEATPEKSAGDVAFEAELSGDDQQEKESEQLPADTPAVERNTEPAVGTSSPGPEQPAEAVRPIPEFISPVSTGKRLDNPHPNRNTQFAKFIILTASIDRSLLWHTLSNQPRERERPARAVRHPRKHNNKPPRPTHGPVNKRVNRLISTAHCSWTSTARDGIREQQRVTTPIQVDMLPTRFCHAETLADLGID